MANEFTEEQVNDAAMCGANTVTQENHEKQPDRNLFDVIGDFFAKMLKGIFIFIFCKLPIKLWEILSDVEKLKKLLNILYSILRAIILCMLWIGVVFLGWWLFLKEQFIRFWQAVFNWFYVLFTDVLNFVKLNAGWIWMILALSGSIYGLIYVTLKRRKKRKLAKATDESIDSVNN